ncbi:unnamed protein product [Eruca vesicaria subsp. sativa]|uniref:F-box domain-containing protein n=1 Tax=Eruca vesicaria subsp. sativa TaxID=29727 RepID=A0ABC8JQE0_ERUVS|nr:unnamed protein product [Eruca vesicaria subsp. sativa]
MTDWSLLPEDLLHVISMHLDNSFQLVHARSVCRSWRSTFPLPSCLLRQSYVLPTFGFDDLPDESNVLCTLTKVPLFFFRVRAPPVDSSSAYVYFLGGVGQDDSEYHTALPSHSLCSVKMNMEESDPTFTNMLDCQILSLGLQYRITGPTPKLWARSSHKSVAFLPLNMESGRDEFVVLIGYSHELFVLKSAEMRWVRLNGISHGPCGNLVTFRGRFYAAFRNGDVFVIDPYSLEETPMMPSPALKSLKYVVPCGDDELFLVELVIPHKLTEVSQVTLRVTRLNEKAGQWVVVRDLGDRLLFIGHLGYFSCSAKELPDGCGVSGNSILLTHPEKNVSYTYIYGVHTGSAEDDLDCWRSTQENRLMISNRPLVVALEVER